MSVAVWPVSAWIVLLFWASFPLTALPSGYNVPLHIRKQPVDKYVPFCRISSSRVDHFTEKETELKNSSCSWIGCSSFSNLIFKKVSKLKSRQILNVSMWKLNDFTFLPSPHQACVVNFQPLRQLHSSVHKSASQTNPNQNITALGPVGATWDAY